MKRQAPLPSARSTNTKLLGRRGMVLIAVLLATVLLSLAAYHYADLMTSEYKATENAVRYSQAKANAESSVHYVMGLLSDPSALGQLNGNLWDNPAYFRDIVVRQDDNARYLGKFSVVSPPYDPTNQGNITTPRFGVIDESSKINPNALIMLDGSGQTLYKMLMTLPNMTSAIACNIVQWLGPTASPFAAPDGSAVGADNSYYTGLNPPYNCKSGPLATIEELLLVSGVTAELLFGCDKNRNGIQDEGEVGVDGTFDPGWAAYLTLYSKEMNLASDGTQRIQLTKTDLNALYESLVTALSDTDMATYIVLYLQYGPATPVAKATGGTPSGGGTPTSPTTKTTTPTTPSPAPAPQTSNNSVTAAPSVKGVTATSMNLTTAKSNNKITSIYSLINTYVNVPTGTDPKGKATYTQYPCPLNDPGKLTSLLPVLLDKCTTTADAQILGRININTAPQAVLMALQGLVPGLTSDNIQQIISTRPALDSGYQQDPTFTTPAWLITQLNISPTVMDKLDKYITTRSQVYRFQVLGYFDGGGPMVRLEAVVDTNNGSPIIMYQRDITELGKGFDLQNMQQ
jgi:type II secretory pathway component PulK